jgi:hypothetical protein
MTGEAGALPPLVGLPGLRPALRQPFTVPRVRPARDRAAVRAFTPRRHWLDGHVVLARALDHPRFARVQTISPRNHVHSFRLRTPAEVDADVRAWLAEAYDVGAQHHLRGDAAGA